MFQKILAKLKGLVFKLSSSLDLNIADTNNDEFDSKNCRCGGKLKFLGDRDEYIDYVQITYEVYKCEKCNKRTEFEVKEP
jgi:hypothetical protein